MSSERAIRNICDTAIWAADYRARETERPDGLFRDPFARRLVGKRGDRIAASLKSQFNFAVGGQFLGEGR